MTMTEHVIPLRPYYSDDEWVTDNLPNSIAPAVELEMVCKFTGRTRFTVLYIGPNGEDRQEHMGPMVKGPWGCLIAQPTVLSAYPQKRGETIEVSAGDVLICNGERMVITDNSRLAYPKLEKALAK